MNNMDVLTLQDAFLLEPSDDITNLDEYNATKHAQNSQSTTMEQYLMEQDPNPAPIALEPPQPAPEKPRKLKKRARTRNASEPARKHKRRDKNSVTQDESELCYTCMLCWELLPMTYSLFIHLVEVHKYGEDEYSTYEVFFRNHNNHVVTRIMSVCEKCDFVHPKRHEVIGHIARVHDEIRLFGCPKCYYASNYKAHLLAHMQDCRKDRQEGVGEKSNLFQCKKCDFTTVLKKYYKNHYLKSHTDFYSDDEEVDSD